jgi:hypothetical protein
MFGGGNPIDQLEALPVELWLDDPRDQVRVTTCTDCGLVFGSTRHKRFESFRWCPPVESIFRFARSETDALTEHEINHFNQCAVCKTILEEARDV